MSCSIPEKRHRLTSQRLKTINNATNSSSNLVLILKSVKHLETITSVDSVVYSATKTGAISPTFFGVHHITGVTTPSTETNLIRWPASHFRLHINLGLSQNEVTTPKFGWFLIFLPIETSNNHIYMYIYIYIICIYIYYIIFSYLLGLNSTFGKTHIKWHPQKMGWFSGFLISILLPNQTFSPKIPSKDWPLAVKMATCSSLV